MTYMHSSRCCVFSARAVLVSCLALVACAPGRELVRSSEQLIEQGRSAEGLAMLQQAVALEPGNASYRMQLLRVRERELGNLLARADDALRSGQLDDAERLHAQAAALAPASTRLRDGQAALAGARREALREASSAQSAAAAMPESAPQDAPVLRAALRKPVSMEFREASLKAVFDALSRATGINFIFDREVRTDAKVTLSVTETSVEDLIGVVALTQQLERKVLNENTVLIYPNTPAKLKDYQDLAVRTFYLANPDAKTVFAMLKTVLKSRDLYADERLNSLTLRDTPEAIRMAEKLIAAQDLAEPEVVLEVEVLEVKRSRLTEIGIEPPVKFSVLNIVPNPSTVVSTATGATTVVNNTLTTTQLTLDRLRGVSTASIGIDNPALNLRSEVGDTNILANPRIRVKNREKARVLIGDRVPVITTTSTANVGVSESVAYLDVGLKLEVEPTVFLDNEVGVKVLLEVSNVVREVRSRSGTLTYQIGTRLANTQLRLRDGETQALAGLISDEDRRSTVGTPGATDLPILGRLLSSQRSDHSKTEIVLLITPRVVRNLGTAALTKVWPSGTETAVGAPALRLRGPAAGTTPAAQVRP